MIVKYIEQKKDKQEDYLDTWVFSYNMSKQDSTQHSPFEFIFAWKPVLPIDINTEGKDPAIILLRPLAKDLSPAHMQDVHLNAAKGNILKAQKTQKEQYDKGNYKPWYV